MISLAHELFMSEYYTLTLKRLDSPLLVVVLALVVVDTIAVLREGVVECGDATGGRLEPEETLEDIILSLSFFFTS